MLIGSALIAGCQPEEIQPLGEPLNVLQNIKGTWQLTKVEQVDEYAKSKSFPYTTLDITNLYSYKDLKITFNADANNAPSNYTIVYGNSPKIIKQASGNWSVDNPEAPQILTFGSGTTAEKVQIGNYNTLYNNQLLLSVKRYQVSSTGAKSLVLSNNYYFTKVNP